MLPARILRAWCIQNIAIKMAERSATRISHQFANFRTRSVLMRCLLVKPLIAPSTLAGALAGGVVAPAAALAEVLTCLAMRKEVPQDRPEELASRNRPAAAVLPPMAEGARSCVLADRRDERLSTLTTAGAADVSMLIAPRLRGAQQTCDTALCVRHRTTSQ